MSDPYRSLKVVEIAERFRARMEADYGYQVCFEVKGGKLSDKSMLVEADLHDWIIFNTKSPVKVLESDVWFVDRDEAVLCHMRFSSGR